MVESASSEPLSEDTILQKIIIFGIFTKKGLILRPDSDKSLLLWGLSFVDTTVQCIEKTRP